MTTLPEIAQLGADCLRQPARPVSVFNQELADTLVAVLATTQGVGLAAPQIGVSQRVVIVGSRPTPRYPYAPEMPPTVMINPEFQSVGDARVKDWEGCLSIPGIRARVPRYPEIDIRYQDLTEVWRQTRLTGFIARVFQHEYDHLNGMVYLDRVESSQDIVTEQEYQRITST